MSFFDLASLVFYGLLWLFLAGCLMNIAWTGYFGFWTRKTSGRRSPAIRSEAPIKFWLTWLAIALPFAWFTFIAFVAILIELSE